MIYFAETHNKKIFTTGAFLQPIKVQDENGREYWIWTVLEFVDDSYIDGEVYNPKETAESVDDLLIDTTEDE